MGRAKLKMELISNEKSRNTTLKKRKEGLVRKMQEFTTLCDVNACMIICNGAAAAPEIWPPNPEQVKGMIDAYKSKSKDSGNKTFGVADFFSERKRKIDDELAKLRRKNLEAKYPTTPPLLDAATVPQLHELALLLANKAKYVKSRIDFLRSTNATNNTTTAAPLNTFYYPPPPLQLQLPQAPPPPLPLQLQLPPPPPPPTFKHAIDHHQHHHNGMMFLVNNDNTTHFESYQFKRQLFFETATGYWAPPPPLPYLPPPPQQQLHFPSREEFIQYQMRNHAANNIQD